MEWRRAGSEEEVFPGLRFAAARAEESIRIEVRFVGAEVAGAGP